MNITGENQNKTVMHPDTLKRGDGYDSGPPDKQAQVLFLQKRLIEKGFSIEGDGIFGRETEQAVRSFQRSQGLSDDGIVGPATWLALGATVTKVQSKGLEDFRGDLSWVHAREGHAGKPYWPGGQSGITLDPGMDLGHAPTALIQDAYAGMFSRDQMQALSSVYGIRGEAARIALKENRLLHTIHISRSQAEEIFPLVAAPYWKKIASRFPALSDKTTPAAVQTAMLSLAYNRGPGNPGLNILSEALNTGNWKILARQIAQMQQDHSLEGIRKRRQMEGELIGKALENIL